MLNFLKTRRFRQGTVATAVTAIVVALIVVIAMVSTAISDKYSLSVDLTENKIFGITDETKEFLKGLDKEVEIIILNSENGFTSLGTYYDQANEVAKKYQQNSGKVKVTYVDITRNPNFMQRYPELQLVPNTILVTCGDKVRDISAFDLYEGQSDQYTGQSTITASKAEQVMTSAILNVTSDNALDVTFLTGHDEAVVTGFRSMLESNNYNVDEINLLTQEIPEETRVAVLSAPKRDLTEDELRRLDAYLSNDGKLNKVLLYFASVEQPEVTDMPNLSAFLADWGIAVEKSVVFESTLENVYNFNMLTPFANYNEEVYSKSVKSRSLYPVFPFSKPLTLLFDGKGYRTVSAPLMFSETSGIVPEDLDENWKPEDADYSGPMPALIVSEELSYEGTKALKSHVVACGTSFAIEDDNLASRSLANGEYFTSLINTICEREETIKIPAKSLTTAELGITSASQILIPSLLLTIVLPLAVFVSGMVVWLRRRHR